MVPIQSERCQIPGQRRASLCSKSRPKKDFIASEPRVALHPFLLAKKCAKVSKVPLSSRLDADAKTRPLQGGRRVEVPAPDVIPANHPSDGQSGHRRSPQMDIVFNHFRRHSYLSSVQQSTHEARGCEGFLSGRRCCEVKKVSDFSPSTIIEWTYRIFAKHKFW